MPRFPAQSPFVSSLRPSVFASIVAQFRTLPAPPAPLHLGDTWRQPPEAARLEHAIASLPKNGYAYANPNGFEPLRAAVADRLGQKGLPGLSADHVHVTSGGTGAIAAVWHTLLQPGDEVLVLAPFWPLVRGIVRSVGGVAVEVPFYPAMRAGRAVAEILAPFVTERTVAVYVTSPNNPCGTVLSRAQLGELAAVCVQHDLWALADEAYHDFAYAPAEHAFLATFPGMQSRTATVLTASKSYALAGTRIGFLVGDPVWLDAARRSTTHAIYQVPLVCQLSALQAVTHGEPWVCETRELYLAARDLTHRTLQARFDPAQGGGYVFADLTDELDGMPMMQYLHDLLREGVCISPGDAFGDAFSSFARICYTAVPIDQLGPALGKLNRSLDRMRRRMPLAA
ncbi:MAG: pyridoxal phosphate-dependent aminotransferase [Deltaproteobacteria bacterium]|nr:pyridoxal phosphate-dependent aminotransferase [Deltaproteobacteria bacterium]